MRVGDTQLKLLAESDVLARALENGWVDESVDLLWDVCPELTEYQDRMIERYLGPETN